MNIKNITFRHGFYTLIFMTFRFIKTAQIKVYYAAPITQHSLGEVLLYNPTL